ncbi:MAG: efflux RND transporter periplasmic adaptor subunit [Candidatus Marinimicrobia bacterium CG08_land_8_20_14_0_20_45_22]|nr:MAG: efflux RND transporter periplasmic adaptor subunit [Candidatus Marinimicrobia bacterium CG08_land_8_20_14_0_20_45_22]
MKKKKWIIPIAVLIIGLVCWFVLSREKEKSESQFTYAKITRGNVENTVSATGTIKARGTVEVGTQVSGIIDHLFVDFNDNVKKNQVLAVLDTTKLALAVRQAESDLQRVQAQYDQTIYEYDRNTDLYQQKLISEQDIIQSKTDKKTTDASLKTAKIALDRAVKELKYAYVKSPIDGKVIYRNVEEGQTVAASFTTPTMFTIAEDLTKMEIRALVDESDIGSIKVGMKARFTVQSYPNETFTGVVRQIWLQPETVSNVVNYTVVLDATNEKNLLLPGMTATIDFLIEHKENILLVPNLALKIQPTDEMMASLRKNMPKRRPPHPDSLAVKQFASYGNRIASKSTNGQNQRSSTNSIPENIGRVWFLDNGGELQLEMIRTGITDGKYTEVVNSHRLSEGMQIIASVTSPDGSVKSSNANNSRQGGPGFGPHPF